MQSVHGPTFLAHVVSGSNSDAVRFSHNCRWTLYVFAVKQYCSVAEVVVVVFSQLFHFCSTFFLSHLLNCLFPFYKSLLTQNTKEESTGPKIVQPKAHPVETWWKETQLRRDENKFLIWKQNGIKACFQCSCYRQYQARPSIYFLLFFTKLFEINHGDPGLFLNQDIERGIGFGCFSTLNKYLLV